MKEERKKVLEMLVEGTISVEEADVLLDILQEPGEGESGDFGEKLKDGLKKTKESIRKAKEKLQKEIERLELRKKTERSLEMLSEALDRAEEKLKLVAEKIKEKYKKREDA